jgi:3-carboxy-cis,cis-muconate cycloisomerase
LFWPSFTTEAMRRTVSDAAWVQAMLDVEAALARAEARAGVIPAEAAEAIAAACDAGRFDIRQLGREMVPAGTPVIPLVKALTAAVSGDAARYVHWGATTQDVVDTAMMLIVRRALDLLRDDLDAVAAECAALAERHRDTVMPGRTLMQQALPITFGLKAAGWLAAVLDARERLAAYRAGRLAIQLGGAAGTLAALADRGLDVARELSAELGLPEPVLPWSTARARVAELGMTLGIVAGTMGKIGLDVALLAQTEVGEVAEPAGEGRGGSSTMPQKRNPIGAMAINACVRGVQAQASLLLASMSQEHERALGAWQAEWGAVSDALRHCAGAVARTREVLDGLQVFEARMRANLELTHGLVMSEHVMMVLAERTGRLRAHELVQTAAGRAAAAGCELGEALRADPLIAENLSSAEIEAALDPRSYLGSTGALIDRALDAYRVGRSRSA